MTGFGREKGLVFLSATWISCCTHGARLLPGSTECLQMCVPFNGECVYCCRRMLYLYLSYYRSYIFLTIYFSKINDKI
uniref:Putative secreted protein n=1 Tax=Anopheles darlingi TaxID=43151 RepID=A0A2M4DG63_ANODA